MGVGQEQTHARHRRLIYRVDCKTPLSCLLMVNGVNFPPVTHLRTINNPAVEISGAQFQQEEVLILGEGGESLTFSNGFLLSTCSLPALACLPGKQ